MSVRLAVPAAPAPKHINPPFRPALLRAIERALCAAWNLLVDDVDARETLETGQEPRITMRLRTKLNHIRRNGGAAGYDDDTFERVQIASEYFDYKDESIRKPDIIFALNGKPRPGVVDDDYDAIFVECKLIEQNNRRNARRYCNEGLARFVEGAYGWRMPQGMMVAYVRTGQILPDALEEAFRDFKIAERLNLQGSLTACPLSSANPKAYISVHDRNWLLPERTAPGPIEVRHLWLTVYGEPGSSSA